MSEENPTREAGEVEKLRQAIEELQGHFQHLATPYEDALSQRVFYTTKKKLLIYFGTWVTVITAVLGFVGFNALNTVINKATHIVSEEIAQRVMPTMKETVMPELMVKEISLQVSELLKESQLDAKTEMDSQVSQAIKTAQNKSDVKLNQALEEIGTKLMDNEFAEQTQEKITEAVKQDQRRSAEGWSYYGAKNPDGAWRKQVFRLEDGQNKNADSVPSQNDHIKAITDVNLRSGPPNYSEGAGWTFSPIESVISSGEVVNVSKVKKIPTVEGEHIWLKVNR